MEIAAYPALCLLKYLIILLIYFFFLITDLNRAKSVFSIWPQEILKCALMLKHFLSNFKKWNKMVFVHLLLPFPHGKQWRVLLNLSPQGESAKWELCPEPGAGLAWQLNRISTGAAPWEFGAAWFGQDKFQESGYHVPKNPLARREASTSTCYKKWLWGVCPCPPTGETSLGHCGLLQHILEPKLMSQLVLPRPELLLIG